MKNTLTFFGAMAVFLGLSSCGDDRKSKGRDEEPRVVFSITSEQECASNGEGYRWVDDRCVYYPNRGTGRKL